MQATKKETRIEKEFHPHSGSLQARRSESDILYNELQAALCEMTSCGIRLNWGNHWKTRSSGQLTARREEPGETGLPAWHVVP